MSCYLVSCLPHTYNSFTLTNITVVWHSHVCKPPLHWARDRSYVQHHLDPHSQTCDTTNGNCKHHTSTHGMSPNISICQPNLTSMPSGKALLGPRRNVFKVLRRLQYQVSLLNERSNIHTRIPIEYIMQMHMRAKTHSITSSITEIANANGQHVFWGTLRPNEAKVQILQIV